jgi:polyisoprenoid-binding protein YceI
MRVKLNSTRIGGLMAAALLVLGTSLKAEERTVYQAKPGASSVKIDGTSTIHDWTVETKLIGGKMELEPSFNLDPAQTAPTAVKELPRVDVIVPVRSLKSGKADMDAVMYTALKMEQHPSITFKLTDMLPRAGAPGAPLAFTTKGDLTVAGVTKSVFMQVSMDRVDQNRVKVTGTTAVKMSDFGVAVRPPKLALGLISVGDDVKITFDWLTERKP